MPRVRFHLALCWWLWAVGGLACSAAADEPALQKPIADLVGAYRADARAEVGVHVLRLADGASLCDIGSRQPMLAASNQKILTTAVAFKRLGEDFAFRTTLAMVGKSLHLFGDGDPTTGDPRLSAQRGQTIYQTFDRWAEALKVKGVARIDDLVVRSGIFQPPLRHPDWPADQAQGWYCAPVSGVNFNDNCFDIGFEVREGRVSAVVCPLSRFITVSNQVALGKKHLWSCQYDGSGARLRLSGTVAGSSSEPLSVAAPDPAMLFASVLADRLLGAGVELKGKVLTTFDPADARGPDRNARVIAHEVTPLRPVLQRCNKNSLNMMAECLFLRSAAEDGQPATWEKAAAVAGKVLTDQYGLDGRQFVVADGSGFSRRGRASPATITALLSALSGQEQFLQSLSVSGVDGSLEDRLGSPLLRGRILGKTGSLAGASALSGYVLNRQGRAALAFSILVNGQTYGRRTSARNLQDSVCELLVRALDAAASRPASAKSN